MGKIISPTPKKKVKSLGSSISAAPSSARKSAADHVSLSGRQQEIVSLLAQGKSNKEIAYYLNVRIQHHQRKTLRKLQKNSATSAG